MDKNIKLGEDQDISLVINTFPEYRFKPFNYYSKNIDINKINNYFVDRIRGTLKKNNFYIYIDNNETNGFISFDERSWDSKVLNKKTARIDFLLSKSCGFNEEYKIKESLLHSALKKLSSENYKYVFLRVNSSDLSSIHILENNKFVMVDGILTYSMNLKDFNYKEADTEYELRLVRKDEQEVNQIQKIASTSYIYDRFHSDPEISDEIADELHSEWLYNSCMSNIVDAVCVANKKGKDIDEILGYVTCSIDKKTKEYLGKAVGTIVLVATKKDCRLSKVAYNVTNYSLKWFKDNNADIVEVGTQLRNIPASRLYENTGFRIVNTSLTYRLIL